MVVGGVRVSIAVLRSEQIQILRPPGKGGKALFPGRKTSQTPAGDRLRL